MLHLRRRCFGSRLFQDHLGRRSFGSRLFLDHLGCRSFGSRRLQDHMGCRSFGCRLFQNHRLRRLQQAGVWRLTRSARYGGWGGTGPQQSTPHRTKSEEFDRPPETQSKRKRHVLSPSCLQRCRNIRITAKGSDRRDPRQD
jgi:hypothetical protein